MWETHQVINKQTFKELQNLTSMFKTELQIIELFLCTKTSVSYKKKTKTPMTQIHNYIIEQLVSI